MKSLIKHVLTGILGHHLARLGKATSSSMYSQAHLASS